MVLLYCDQVLQQAVIRLYTKHHNSAVIWNNFPENLKSQQPNWSFYLDIDDYLMLKEKNWNEVVMF